MRIALGSIALVGTGPARVRAESSGPVVVHVGVSPGGKTWHVTGGAGASLNFSYFPTTVTVRPGVRVVWTNTSPLPEPHTVTFLPVNPQTGEIDGPPLEIVRPKPGHAGSQNPVDQDVVENPLDILPSTVTHASFRTRDPVPRRDGPGHAVVLERDVHGHGRGQDVRLYVRVPSLDDRARDRRGAVGAGAARVRFDPAGIPHRRPNVLGRVSADGR